MTNLQRRLRKLEGLMTDRSGLLPGSPAWIEYWMPEIERVVRRDDPGAKPKIPLEALRIWLQAQPDRDHEYFDSV